MASFKVIAKNNSQVEKKPRVYFTCHPDDFVKYFKRICEDLFATHDCAIYYTEDMTEAISEDEREVDLERFNLFVVPITLKLLTTPNRAMDEDILYAKSEHIPILPIMMESGIDAIYSLPDKFGERQYLNPYSADLTEISYSEKLKKYLEAVLISDEMARRVRNAFDAYIFLSYRKKDRKYANELMRLIHSNPECRDIAIWFDEFLTPGESFKESIEKMLEDSKLFTLLVTPQLLERVIDENGIERDNYVISTELPLARKKKEEKGTDILSVEMERTDRGALSEINIEDCVNFKDREFRERLLEAVKRIAITKNDTPEHNFLIGLAYLEGIDMEVNRERGVELITASAEENLPEAMEKLFHMYSNGEYVQLDYYKAVIWIERLAEYYLKTCGEEDRNTLWALNELSAAYSNHGDYNRSLETAEMVCALYCRVLGEEHPDTLLSLNNLAAAYSLLGYQQKAAELKERVYELRRRVLGNEHPDTLITLSNLAVTYGLLGDYKKALELKEKLYALSCEALGQEHPDTINALNNLAHTYGDIGEYEKALELNERAYGLYCKVLGQEHPDTLGSLSNLAVAYNRLGENGKALELNERAYELRCRVLGEAHPLTLRTLNNLAVAYSCLGDQKTALELKERAYELRCRVLGREHPDTLMTLANLSMTYSKLGEYEKALDVSKRVYELRYKVLGPGHPETAAALGDLAVAFGDTGDHQKEAEIGEKAYKLQSRLLGEKHPTTLITLGNLAMAYIDIGERKRALDLFEELYPLQVEVFGQEHPRVARTEILIDKLRSVLKNEK